ncbi:hypothetical protein [Palleronia marisminoris]|uniref:hypothetical protein n=1 Tax=Palleronia marisminoris TaxID=315423 RepID=UPI0011136DD4|nr:hypothetical protein [Palleronia marisminoris]
MTTANLTPERQMRLLQAQARADRKLTNYPDRLRDILLGAVLDTPSGRAFVLGTAEIPGDDELIDELWSTSTGVDLRAILEDHQASAPANAAEAAKAEILAIQNPAQRMAAARRAGIAGL